jgi:hypothetical protein
MKLRERFELMGHQHVPSALIEGSQRAKRAARPHGALQHTPEAFEGVQVMAAGGRQEVQASPPRPASEDRRDFVGTMHPTAGNGQDDCFAGGAAGGHEVGQILTESQRGKRRDQCIKNLRGAVLHGPQEGLTRGGFYKMLIMHMFLPRFTQLLSPLASGGLRQDNARRIGVSRQRRHGGPGFRHQAALR